MNHARSNRIGSRSCSSDIPAADRHKRVPAAAAKLAAFVQLSLFFIAGHLSADQTYSGNEIRSAFPNNKTFMESSKEKQRDFQILMKRAKALNERGMTAENKKKEKLFSEAMTCADSLVARRPNSAIPYFLKSLSAGNLAAIRSGKDKVLLSRETVQCAKKAIALDPSFAEPHIVLGTYYREVARASSFLKSMAKRLYGEFPEGTLKDSERALLAALALAPNDMFAHFEIGKTYMAMKRNDKAKTHFNRVLGSPGTSDLTRVVRQNALDTLDKLHS